MKENWRKKLKEGSFAEQVKLLGEIKKETERLTAKQIFEEIEKHRHITRRSLTPDKEPIFITDKDWQKLKKKFGVK